MLRAGLDPRLAAERILDGPTSEVWIDPWRRYLETRGVAFHLEAPVRELHVEDGRLVAASVEGPNGRERVTADRFVLAVPVEAARALFTDEIHSFAPELAGLDELDTAWMNGCQFYLREDVPLSRGHQLYVDSPWALTSVSQAQFWDVDLRKRSGGEVGGVLSVIVSDWETPGVVFGKPARACTPEEIREEVWTQLTDHLNRNGTARLTEDVVVDWFLDPSITESTEGEGVENDAPLLVNTVGSLKHRPPADPGFPGLYLAADYVRTHTDLASMEAANEAARRAVNAILDDAGSDADRCMVEPLAEPAVLAPLKAHDELNYRLGLPHPGRVRRGVGARVRELFGVSK